MAYFDQRVLRAEIVKATDFIRHTLMRYSCDENFTMTIEVKGSADKADARLKFGFDTSRYYGTTVNSPVLHEAVSELLRRRGFDKVHEAELLTYDADKEHELAGLQAPTPASPAATEDD